MADVEHMEPTQGLRSHQGHHSYVPAHLAQGHLVHDDDDSHDGHEQQADEDSQVVVHDHLSADHQHPHLSGHSHQHEDDNGMADDDQDDDPGDGEGLDEADMHSDPNLGEAPMSLAVRGQGNTQLTLSYQGEVYVFDTVPPEKVQAVLLLLGGREIPPGMSGATMSAGHHHKGLAELPARMNMPQRLASLNRFREKRKERCYDKKIRYTVRKEVAQRMQRKKGQFASSRNNGDDGRNPSNWDSTPLSGQVVGGSAQQEIICVHCHIGEQSTPMMRRGPAGPRTLCNACGLMWATKGVLRDLSKSATGAGGSQPPQVVHQQQIIIHQQQQQIAALQSSLQREPGSSGKAM